MTEKQTTAAHEKQSGIPASEMLRDLEKMSPEQKAKVVDTMKKSSRFDRFLTRAASIGGAAWDGWEKWVNGSLRGIGEWLEWMGKMIGEGTAVAIHGKEWEFLDYAVEKTEFIRKGLNTVGNSAIGTANVMRDNGFGKTISNSVEFWKEQGTNANGMSAEEFARTAGKIAGGVAVWAVTGYALKAAQTSSILGKNVFTWTGLVWKTADNAVKQVSQLGMEFAWWKRLKTAQLEEIGKVKELSAVYKRMSILKAELAETKGEIAKLSKALEAGHDPELANQLDRLVRYKNSLKDHHASLSDTIKNAGINQIEEKIEDLLSKGGVNEGRKVIERIASEESKKKENATLSNAKALSQIQEKVLAIAAVIPEKATKAARETEMENLAILRLVQAEPGKAAFSEAAKKINGLYASLDTKIQDLNNYKVDLEAISLKRRLTRRESEALGNIKVALGTLEKAKKSTMSLEDRIVDISQKQQSFTINHPHPSHG